MQQRHTDRQSYFNELANTSRDFYIDYLKRFIRISTDTNVLEIGCGEGGNLLPFAEKGCHITGIDRATTRISQAKEFFAQAGYEGSFTAIDFFEMDPQAVTTKYDIILIHDVIEHIDKDKKLAFVNHAKRFLSDKGIIFWGFPAWQMPFGGHQQICQHKFCASMPFIHLLPTTIYKKLLILCGEKENCINELLDIKACKMSIEQFEQTIKASNCQIVNRQLWFINPHYKQKFNLKPRKLALALSSTRYIRNFFATACFYITR